MAQTNVDPITCSDASLKIFSIKFTLISVCSRSGFFGKFFFLMYMKHIARVNAHYIMCTQYQLSRDDFNAIAANPTSMPLHHVVESMRQSLQCYHCSTSCAWKDSLSTRITKLIQHDECDTYVRDDVCAYCSENCLMRDSGGVLDDRTQSSLDNSTCE